MAFTELLNISVNFEVFFFDRRDLISAMISIPLSVTEYFLDMQFVELSL